MLGLAKMGGTWDPLCTGPYVDNAYKLDHIVGNVKSICEESYDTPNQI